MSPALLRIVGLSSLIGVLLGFTGCTTPSPAPAPAATRTPPPTTSPDVIVQARFERLVQQVVETEQDTTALLDRIQHALPRPTQASVDRELLALFNSEGFAAMLDQRAVLTNGRIMEAFAPGNATALREAGLDRPLLALTDKLVRLAAETRELAAGSEDGRTLQRIFTLLHHDVLPALVETRAIVIEEALDNNEAAALAQRMEQQLQSINDQLASLKSRARSVTAPPPSS